MTEAEEAARRLENKVWRSNDGREIPVSELSNSHLGAALHMLERKRALHRYRTGKTASLSQEEKMLELELRRRWDEA